MLKYNFSSSQTLYLFFIFFGVFLQKYESQTVYGSHSHKTGTTERRNGNNDQSGEVTKVCSAKLD